MKRLFVFDLIPACVVSVIMGTMVLFDEIPHFLMFIPVLCMGIHTFMMPLYYILNFGVMHFNHGLGCIKGALGTMFAGLLSGVIFYGLCDILEAFQSGIFKVFFMDSEFLPVILLPEAIIVLGVVVILFVSLLGRLEERKNNK